ncbi:MAG: hypothetical protein ABH952_05980 [Candidatus Omnitrophota bacterium]
MSLIFNEKKIKQSELKNILTANIRNLQNNLRIVDLECDMVEKDTVLFAADARGLVVIAYSTAPNSIKLIHGFAAVGWLKKNFKLVKGYLKGQDIACGDHTRLWYISSRHSDELKQAIGFMNIPVTLISYKYIYSEGVSGILFERFELNQLNDVKPETIEEEPSLIISAQDQDRVNLTSEEEAEFINFGKLINP